MKKLILSTAIILSFGLGTANAQLKKSDDNFIGVNNLAVTQSFTNTMLMNAINNKDWTFLNAWEKEKGFKFPVSVASDKSCMLYYLDTGYEIHPTKYKPKDFLVNASHELFNYAGYLIFTKCDEAPMMQMLKNYYLNHAYTPSALKYYKGTIDQEKAAEQKLINSYFIKFIDNLQPSQYEQLVFVVLRSDLDIEVRKKALVKYKEFIKNFDTIALPEQKAYRSMAIESSKKGYYSNRKDFSEFYATDPLYYLFLRLAFKLTSTSTLLLKSEAYNNEKAPVVKKAFWEGTLKITPNDYLTSPQYYPSTSDIVLFFEEAELLKDIMYTEGFNINKQDSKGNTYLHTVWNADPLRRYSYEHNHIHAGFYRFLLENGADARLLNQDQKTPHMLFEEIRLGNEAFRFYNDAFTQQQYKY